MPTAKQHFQRRRRVVSQRGDLRSACLKDRRRIIFQRKPTRSGIDGGVGCGSN
jgi:hypothetical protein